MKKNIIILLVLLVLFGCTSNPSKPTPTPTPTPTDEPQDTHNKYYNTRYYLQIQDGEDTYMDQYENIFFDSDDTFVYSINLCDKIGEVTGSYTVSDDEIQLVVEKKNFTGYSNSDLLDKFTLQVIDEQTLTIKLENFPIGCGTWNDSKFIKEITEPVQK